MIAKIIISILILIYIIFLWKMVFYGLSNRVRLSVFLISNSISTTFGVLSIYIFHVVKNGDTILTDKYGIYVLSCMILQLGVVVGMYLKERMLKAHGGQIASDDSKTMNKEGENQDHYQ